MHPVKLLERATSTAFHAVRHPVSSAAYTAGLARGLVGAAIHGATGGGHEQAAPSPVPTQRAESPEPAATTAAPPEPQRVPKPVPTADDLPEPVVIEAVDEEPGEAFATEPKAVTRESAHGGATTEDAEIDAWDDEAERVDVDVETPVGTTGADVGRKPATAEADLQQPLTQPLMDPATAKAIRSETQMLQKDAQRDVE
jgi:hypothetical protein